MKNLSLAIQGIYLCMYLNTRSAAIYVAVNLIRGKKYARR
jgi:hypothetical protein